MKGEAFIIIFLIFLISNVSAVLYECSNQNDLRIKSEEINEGSTKTLLSVPLGICGATQSSVYGWIETQVFIDTNLITLSGTNFTTGTELISSNSSVSFTNPSSSSIKIKISNTESVIDLGDCITINNHVVLLKEITGSNSNAVAKVLVGKEKILLNTLTNQGDIIEFQSKKYGIQLLSGSHTDSTIRISTCDEGDIIEISAPLVSNETNSTNPQINTTINSTQNQNNSTSISQNNTNSTSQRFIIEPNSREESKGFFRKIFDWIKSLFVKD